MREVREGDVIEIKFMAPKYITKKILTLKLAIIQNSLLQEAEEYCFVDEACTYFVNVISGGGDTGAVVQPHSFKRLKEYPEYKFIRFYDFEM